MRATARGTVVLGALLLGLMSAARADSVGNSILVFPDIAGSAERDTIVQMANTQAALTFAQCWYGPGVALPSGDSFATTPFHLWLTARQPTYWQVAGGRPVDTTDAQAGFDPGRIPAFPREGSLVCVEVDPGGRPISGNHLVGTATITETSGSVIKYDAIGLQGFDTNNGDGNLCLGSEQPSETCPTGAEYEGCPKRWFFAHPAESSELARNRIAVMPCSLDLDHQHGSSVLIQMRPTNEFEERFATSLSFSDHARAALAEISNVFFEDRIGGTTVYTELNTSASSGAFFAVGASDGSGVNLMREGSVPALLVMEGNR